MFFRFLIVQKGRRGQSLVEVLIAISIGVLIMLTVGTIISSSIRTNDAARKVQVGSALARELMENVRAWSETHWSEVSSTDPNTFYYLNTSSSPYSLQQGVQTVIVGTSTYSRYFKVAQGLRDGSGYLGGGGGGGGSAADPSTFRITVFYNWPGNTTKTLSTYLTRNTNRVFMQSDWSAGSVGVSSVTTSSPTNFATSSKILYTATSGALYMQLP